MKCLGSLYVFNDKTMTCQSCETFELCREKVVRFLRKIRKKSKAEKIIKSEKKSFKKIPKINENLPVVTRQKILALYRRGFSYCVGQRENPFTDEDPSSYRLIYQKLFERKRMTKLEIRKSIIENLGWSDLSAKVEVSRVMGVLVEVGVAKLNGNVLEFCF